MDTTQEEPQTLAQWMLKCREEMLALAQASLDIVEKETASGEVPSEIVRVQGLVEGLVGGATMLTTALEKANAQARRRREGR